MPDSVDMASRPVGVDYVGMYMNKHESWVTSNLCKMGNGPQESALNVAWFGELHGRLISNLSICTADRVASEKEPPQPSRTQSPAVDKETKIKLNLIQQEVVEPVFRWSSSTRTAPFQKARADYLGVSLSIHKRFYLV